MAYPSLPPPTAKSDGAGGEVFGRAGGERRRPTAEVMNCRGVEFTIVQIERALWRWRFQIGETVSTGKTETALMGMAARRVRVRIDFELKKRRGLGQPPEAPGP